MSAVNRTKTEAPSIPLVCENTIHAHWVSDAVNIITSKDAAERNGVGVGWGEIEEDQKYGEGGIACCKRVVV